MVLNLEGSRIVPSTIIRYRRAFAYLVSGPNESELLVETDAAQREEASNAWSKAYVEAPIIMRLTRSIYWASVAVLSSCCGDGACTPPT